MENETQPVDETNNTEIPDIDLPIDTSAPRAAARIHMAPGESACVSCEG